MPYRGGRRRKRYTPHPNEEVTEREKELVPRCFVLRRGSVGGRVRALVEDFRDVMMPNCARNLKERRRNRLEDFVAVAGTLKVSHLIMFTAGKSNTWMKLAKLPQGPTLTFQVNNFSLAKDVRSSQRKHMPAHDFDLISAPLQVLSGFTKADDKDGVQRLTGEMVRGLFPPVDVQTFSQAECRRAALFNYDKEKDVIHFRHFTVTRKTSGVQRGVSKLLRPAKVPKLGHCKDVADFVLSGGLGAAASESEMEEVHEAQTTGGTGRVAVKLIERGPRLTLQLVKAQEGLCDGNVLYHRYNKRAPTKQELQEARARRKRKMKERDDRLDAKAKGEAKKKKRRVEEEEERETEEKAEGFVGISGPPQASRAGKRKRFHPLAFRAKKPSQKSKKGKAKSDEAGAAGGAETS